MRLQAKLLILIAGSMLLLTGVNMLVGIRTLLGIIDRQDLEYARLRTETYAIVASQGRARLNSLASDWAMWTDLADYSASGRGRFAEDYLNDESFETMRIEGMAILSPAGDVRAAIAKDGVIDPTDFTQWLNVFPPIRSMLASPALDVRDGYAWVGDTLVIYTVAPITNNDGSLPQTGLLVLVRGIILEIPQNMLAHAETSVTRSWPEALEGKPLDVPGIADASVVFSSDRMTLVLPLDVTGEKGTLRISLPHDGYSRARRAGIFTFLLVACLGVAACLFFIISFRRSILKRLFAITRFMQRLDLNATEAEVLPVKEKSVDELDALAADVNRAVARIGRDNRKAQGMRRFLESVLEASGAGSFELDASSGLIHMDDRLLRLLGMEAPPKDLVLDALAPFADLEDFTLFQQRLLQSDESVDNEELVVRFYPDLPSERWLSFRCSDAVSDGTDSARHIIGLVNDVTEAHRRELALEFAGLHDTLTGLSNRKRFDGEILRLEMERELPYAILMADLNGLKMINDTFGHLEGDRLIQSAARILRTCIREEDIVCRWGGDEYTAILSHADATAVGHVCQRIQEHCLSTFDTVLPVSMAIGFAIRQGDEESVEAVIALAEADMYRVKSRQQGQTGRRFAALFLEVMGKQWPEVLYHSERVAGYAEAVARELYMPAEAQEEFVLLARMHDVGMVAEKLGSASSLAGDLLGADAIDADPDRIPRHVEVGYRISKANFTLQGIAWPLLLHHSHFDGTGFPGDVQGDALPLFSRLLAIIDAFDRMTFLAAAQQRISTEEAILRIEAKAGTWFDPRYTEICGRVFRRMTGASKEWADVREEKGRGSAPRPRSK